MIPSNTTQGAKRITPECQPVFPCWLWIEGPDFKEGFWLRYEHTRPVAVGYTRWHADQPDAPTEIPSAPASPSPGHDVAPDGKPWPSLLPRVAASPVTEETNGEADWGADTIEKVAKVLFSPGQLDKEPGFFFLGDMEDCRTLAKHCLEAITPSPSAPAQQGRKAELLHLVIGTHMGAMTAGECADRIEKLFAPSAAQQDKGWAERAAKVEPDFEFEGQFSQQAQINAYAKGFDDAKGKFIKLAPPSATPSSLSAQGDAADQDFLVPKYRSVPVGEFGPSEWLELLMCCQSGYATCMRVMEYIDRETVPIGCLKKLHPKSLEVCYAIERLPAGEQQTALSIQASAVAQEIQRLAATPPNVAPEGNQK